jgi:hypothetical protein
MHGYRRPGHDRPQREVRWAAVLATVDGCRLRRALLGVGRSRFLVLLVIVARKRTRASSAMNSRSGERQNRYQAQLIRRRPPWPAPRLGHQGLRARPDHAAPRHPPPEARSAHRRHRPRHLAAPAPRTRPRPGPDHSRDPRTRRRLPAMTTAQPRSVRGSHHRTAIRETPVTQAE